MDITASIFIKKKVRLTCPRCKGKLVKDGGPGKERYTKSPASHQFRCKKCGKKVTFSRSAEGLIATACITMSRMLIFGVELSRRMKMFGLALGASLLEAMQM